MLSRDNFPGVKVKYLVIANYFGRLPSAFQAWLDSCGCNTKLNWLFVTDCDLSSFSVPDNMKIEKTTFDLLKKKIQGKVPFKVRYSRPWDFCAIKPLLGHIFSDELAEYDYWGWSDVDVLYGDLSPCLSMAPKFDKIMPSGHFSVIKNDKKLNAFILKHPLTYEALSLSRPGLPCFDEVGFPFGVLKDYGAKQDNDTVPFIHLYPRRGNFWYRVSIPCNRELFRPNTGSEPFVMTWSGGRLVAWFAMPDRSVKTIELAYVHFFKRDIKLFASRLKNDGQTYLIQPSGISVFSGRPLTYWQIRYLNRPRIHWAYWRKRMTPKFVVGKLFNAINLKRRNG